MSSDQAGPQHSGVASINRAVFEKKFAAGGWTNRRLATKAGVAEGTIRRIRKLGTGRPDTIKEIAAVFAISLESLVLSQGATSNRNEDVERYYGFFVMAFSSTDLGKAMNDSAEPDEFDVIDYVQRLHGAENHALRISGQDREETHDRLCQEGYLEKSADGRYRFTLLNHVEYLEGTPLRAVIEVTAAKRAVVLLRTDERQHAAIISRLTEALNALATEYQVLCDTDEAEHAIACLGLDCKFHIEWAGQHLYYRQMLQQAVTVYNLAGSRLVKLLRAAGKQDLRVSESIPTMKHTLGKFCEDLQLILKRFIEIESVDDFEGITLLTEAIEEHASHSDRVIRDHAQLLAELDGKLLPPEKGRLDEEYEDREGI